MLPRRSLIRLLVSVIIVGLAGESVMAAQAVCIPVKLFDMGTGCELKGEFKDSLMKEITIYEWLNSYIAPPREGQDRNEWLRAMKAYRDAVRNGTIDRNACIGMNFDGVRAWARLDIKLSRILALQPGDELQVEIEARWLSGNSRICLAFDKQNSSDSQIGWTGVIGTVEIPKDSQWHKLRIAAKVPDFDTKEQWLRPIVGMDATQDPTPGKVEIKGFDVLISDPKRMAQATEYIRSLPGDAFDRSLYDEPSQQWIQGAFTCHFTFVYDKAFYDPDIGEYKLDSFLKDGRDEFGCYDILLLWHAYPRIGVDERNQLDFYRDMPGGIDGIGKLVQDCHKRNVKVFINYNPWDTGTAREGKTDADFLVEFVAQTQVDGIFLDTMFGSDTIRQKLEEAKPGIVLCPEGGPPIKDLGTLNGSWAQWSVEKEEFVPSLDHRKWIEPRHTRWQIWRWMPDHREEIRRAFFNGGGMLVWENIFGSYNPWLIENRRMWRRAVPILRYFVNNFTCDEWAPYYPAAVPDELTKDAWPDREVPGLFIHRWPGEKCNVFTLFVKDRKKLEFTAGRVWYRKVNWPLFEVPYNPDMLYYDLWNGLEIKPERLGDKSRISGFIDRFSGIGCVLEIDNRKVDRPLIDLLAAQRSEAEKPVQFTPDRRNFAQSVLNPEPVRPTARVPADKPPAGMVFVPGGKKHIHIEHWRRESGCYPDPLTPADHWEKFLWGDLHDQNIVHDFDAELEPFFIDETEVTNAEFKKFLDKTGYRPKFSKNFLKHWPDGKMPTELADHPVVYIDVDDARAYAKWAGKRLPTEYEWHLAAQGTDERKWPWGNEFDPNRCNTTGDRTMPVRSLPEGRSPCGCYHMSGNVWEWTESCRDDGHTRFVIIRGGSYFKAEGSQWYVAGGPQPCDSHTKFIRMWPGLDRCATVGFRCVVDAGD